MGFIRCGNDGENAAIATHWMGKLFLREGVKPAGTIEYREGITALSRILADTIHKDLVCEDASYHDGTGVLLVPVMVAGLGLHHAFLERFPAARVGPIWTENLIPGKEMDPALNGVDAQLRRSNDRCIILDQVAATGNTLALVTDIICGKDGEEKKRGQVVIATLFASSVAVQLFASQHPFYGIDANGTVASHMLVPGPGDTGKRWRGIVPPFDRGKDRRA